MVTTNAGVSRRQLIIGGLSLPCAGFSKAAKSPATTWSPSQFHRIDPATLVPTFEDTFDAFDRARDPDDRNARWMTNFANGPEDGIDSRTLANNSEQQIYVDPEFGGLGLDPFRVTPRGLLISADRVPPLARSRLWDRPYYSGMISTRRSFSQLYGYFEIEAQLPRGQGFWPAFWMLPASGAWPPELDVMEALGSDPWSSYTTVHSRFLNLKGRRIRAFANLSNRPHRFGVSWTPKELIWYRDRREVSRLRTPDDLHQPMYMLANLAVGGVWAKSPDRSTQFPGTLAIRAIRAWRFPSV
jgi:beta-glucanase (GH16 family)